MISKKIIIALSLVVAVGSTSAMADTQWKATFHNNTNDTVTIADGGHDKFQLDYFSDNNATLSPGQSVEYTISDDNSQDGIRGLNITSANINNHIEFVEGNHTATGMEISSVIIDHTSAGGVIASTSSSDANVTPTITSGDTALDEVDVDVAIGQNNTKLP
ncbi:hypothetical protein OAO18_00345 [Francisellaceae bacterium]|nr:hypothetical protein [Francisellaceae bacterium]